VGLIQQSWDYLFKKDITSLYQHSAVAWYFTCKTLFYLWVQSLWFVVFVVGTKLCVIICAILILYIFKKLKAQNAYQNVLRKKKGILVIWFDELNLTSRVELFVNFKRTELELNIRFISKSSQVLSRTNSYQVESSSDEFDSTRLISSPNHNQIILISILGHVNI